MTFRVRTDLSPPFPGAPAPTTVIVRARRTGSGKHIEWTLKPGDTLEESDALAIEYLKVNRALVVV